MIYDFCVVGGGIVGLAVAMKLLELRPGSSLLLLEKEAQLACHQTGHDSSVIHSGLSYEPGSHKARLCLAGVAAVKSFCAEYGVPFEVCGKLVVATNAMEMKRLPSLREQKRTRSRSKRGTRANSVGTNRTLVDWLRYLYLQPELLITGKSARRSPPSS